MLSEKQKVQEKEYDIPYKYFFTDKKLIGFPQKLFVTTDYMLCQECIIGLIAPFENQLFLDAGCGDGRLCSILKEKNIQVFGNDYSIKAISFAKIYNPTADFQVGDLTGILPYEDKFFDCIVLIEVIEHIQPELLLETITQLNRILKDNGKIIITVPHKNRKLDLKHFQHFDSSSLSDLIEPFFNVKKMFGFHKAAFFPNLIFNLIVIAYYYVYPLKLVKLSFLSDWLTRYGYYFFKKCLRDSKIDEGLTLICVATKK